LVFKKINQLGEYFDQIKNKIKKLHQLSHKLKVPVVALCLNFPIFNMFVDKVIVGVDSLVNLKEINHALRYQKDYIDIYNELLKFKETNEKLIVPFHWKSGKLNS